MAYTPRISVIIPAYNAEQTIRRACESVLSQDYPNVELIVVNDGSKDDTESILRGLQSEHANMQCIHQVNGGVCRARNAGMEQAGGEYFFFLDADDALAPNCLTRLYHIAAENGCDIVAGSSLRIFPDGSTRTRPFVADGETCVWEGREALRHSLEDHPATYAVWGKLYRKAAVDSVRFVEGKRIHEDSFFLFEAFLHEPKMAVVNDIAVHYYVTQNSASRAKFSDKFLDILYFANKKCEIVEKKYPEFLPLAKNVQVKASLSLLNVMRTNVDPKFKQVEKDCLAMVHKNARYFIPAIPLDRILFRIVRFRLYWLYKLAYRFYRKLRH